MIDSEGRALLVALVQRVRARTVAARCRVARSTVSMWIAGTRTPSATSKKALVVHFGIPVESWARSARSR
jgi:transcriptional regulator with XRE-family HTH domain